jgi:sigma-B regulation protein RsbU (phosphoserine phosphatase)
MQAPPGEFDLSHTLPARLFLVSLVLIVPLLALQQFLTLPAFVEMLRKVVSIALIVSGGWLGGLALWRNRRWLLWRVRRKLIISYVLFGVVPVVLVVMFVVAGGFVLYSDFAAYLLHEGIDDVLDDLRQAAMSAGTEVGRGDAAPGEVLEVRYENLRDRYPALSLALLSAAAPIAGAPAPNGPAPTAPAALATAGPWRHLPAPTTVPSRVVRSRGFRGVIVIPSNGSDLDEALVLRVAVPAAAGALMVVADLPVDTSLVAHLERRTGARIEGVTIDPAASTDADAPAPDAPGRPVPRRLTRLFQQTVAFMDAWPDWSSERVVRISVSLAAPIGGLYERLTAARSSQLAPVRQGIGLALFVIGGLLLVVQVAVLIIGAFVGRSITSAVHELFAGTQRIQQGDFSHRIRIGSRDQLGDLAESFNRMSASIAHLLHVQRDKQRLDDELRIARDIQQSLLPAQPPTLDGLSVADLCEPAREVGGDYYDFFLLGPRQLGIVIADVSGKGTSAALYMAELKGLMLALSYTERSPRKLLVDVNRRLAGQLDNRSFITMTYAVIDLDAMTLTCARAGHTPLIVVSGDRADVLVPDGMVLGLRIPGALERFEQLLTEHTRPLAPGDLIVLYTDGLTEAMDGAGELFGDAALAGLLAKHRRLDAAGVRERVLREVKAFVGEAEPHDDMTMVVLKLTGGPAAS